ncbi:site-specific DNA-methyltransferase [Cronobacter sakazakii]|uniref:site-specific DNA-methyltransferase n=2 Tax=Mixta calida TaxID=665913 RepID=UPI0028A05353|nr:site-specific DNA-methyltransferase [Mixta calida]ELY3420717.1 site-specific DNA-methyltransferase [Cronobacter sakazakii]
MKNVIPEMDSQSMDIVADNISKLKELFPEAFTEGKVDFDALKEVLGDYIDSREERYSFTWNGKSKARMLAQTPSTGTLRPCKEESVDWDNTQNLFIEGDNLEVLKLLQKSYHKQVKMIYIDPPYNTGNEFIYPDNFQDSIGAYLKITGQLTDEGLKLSNNQEYSGRFHTNWLNMIYPRLKLAKNLLRQDGAIFISIGQDELQNLLYVCNELFGEENLVTICSRIVKTGGQKGIHFSPSVDYIVCYAKNIGDLNQFREEISQNVIDNVYTKIETEGPLKGEKYRSMGLYQAMLDKRANQRYFIECPDGSLVIPPGNSMPEIITEGEQVKPGDGDGVWRWTYSRYQEEKAKGNIDFIKSDKTSLITSDGKIAEWNVYYKIWLKDRLNDGQLPGNILDKFQSRHASAELKKLKIPFDFPKPSILIRYLMTLVSMKSGDIALDFFAGSCSLAHAVLDYTCETKFPVRFVCVQLPERLDDNSAEAKLGFSTIAEIGKERIRRAAAKIQEENPDFQGDLGFKVFKLDSTNIKPWELDFDLTEQDLEDQISNIKYGRKEEDVLYEVLLKYGLNLTLPVTKHSVAGHKVFDIGMGALMICLSDDITLDVVEGIAKLKDELKPEIMRVVFKDAGFADDVVKTNAVQILKQAGIEDVRSL